MTGSRQAGTRAIVIVGNGLAAWMSAAALTRILNPDDWSIRLVAANGNDDDPCYFGAADATLPFPPARLKSLLVNEDRVISETGGAFTFGIALSGWQQPDKSWFHPFGETGAGHGPVSFHHLVLKLRKAGLPVRLADYSLAALAAQAGRFTRSDGDPHSVLSACRNGLHLDCRNLTASLRRQAVSSGIVCMAGTLAHVECREDGTIAAVIGHDGTRIEGELFLDCSGSKACLISDVLGVDWIDWSPRLPCDRVQFASFGSPDPPPPFSHSQAHPGGWVRQVPIAGGMSLASYYHDGVETDDAAHDRLQKAAAGRPLVDVRSLVFCPGRRTRLWEGNCLALGAAAQITEPIAVSNLHILMCSVGRLLELLPGGDGCAAVAAEYNRRTAAQLDYARDFAMLHYKLNGRRGESMWDACRDMPIPESLEYRLELYAGLGRIAMFDDEPLEAASWVSLFDAAGIEPRRYNPAADGFDEKELERHLARVREVMLSALASMPPHAAFLDALRADRPAGPEA